MLEKRKIPEKREYFVERGDGYDDLLDRCQQLIGCYKCHKKPVPIIQKQRSRDSKWMYLACPTHGANRTYLNMDYAAMCRAWEWLQRKAAKK